jgi:NAD(P)-dependent dehydrogenase (short-subunit alcohol dehydrogenase family)
MTRARTLEGRIAVVTGGGRGIGAATARALAREGAAVAVVARSRDEIDAVAAEIVGAGGRATALACDVIDEVAVATLPDLVNRSLRAPASILVHSAGGAGSAPFDRLTIKEWRTMLEVNATSAFLCARVFAPILAEHGAGRLVFVASIAGLAGARYLAHYTAAKHAVVGLMRALAAEYAGKGLTVNAVCPGFVDTAITEQAVAGAERRGGLSREEALAAVLASAEQARLLAPEEVADEIVALCHPDAAGANGEAIVLHPRSTT